MATIVKNKQGFKVVKLNKFELILCGFGNICDRCNDIIYDNYYYVAVLSMLICEECYNKWIEGAKRYVEDIPYEKRNFNYVLYELKNRDIDIHDISEK